MTDDPKIEIGYARGYVPQGESCGFVSELIEVARVPVTYEPVKIKKFPRFSDRGYEWHLHSKK